MDGWLLSTKATVQHLLYDRCSRQLRPIVNDPSSITMCARVVSLITRNGCQWCHFRYSQCTHTLAHIADTCFLIAMRAYHISLSINTCIINIWCWPLATEREFPFPSKFSAFLFELSNYTCTKHACVAKLWANGRSLSNSFKAMNH